MAANLASEMAYPHNPDIFRWKRVTKTKKPTADKVRCYCQYTVCVHCVCVWVSEKLSTFDRYEVKSNIVECHLNLVMHKSLIDYLELIFQCMIKYCMTANKTFKGLVQSKT